jgi:signal transduction histidine kinase
MALSYKNRIASYYIFTTAFLVFGVFFLIFSMVKISVYNHVDQDIVSEVEKHVSEIEISDHTFKLIHKNEWEEREHNTLDVNPVFVEFMDANHNIIEKSPNLKTHKLHFDPNSSDNILFDTKLNAISIRQVQVPILNKNQKIGYVLVAMSLEDSSLVIHNLFKILAISYPIILLVLFVIARFIAGRSIKPINSIIETSNRITKDNLSDRIVLPQNKDELYVVSLTINQLLDRIENAVEREKQFTSYASHELRTPISIIKGTLEVLIRKPRNQAEYEEKISYCIDEVDRINTIIDQLLILARFENQKKSVDISSIQGNAVLQDVLLRFQTKIASKNISIITDYPENLQIKTDLHLFSIIIHNLVSNALKYSINNGVITFSVVSESDKIHLKIQDSGIGIAPHEIHKIFDSFYRTEASNELPEIKGTGLGLAIVNRLCALLSIEIKVESEVGKGTLIILTLLK